MTLVAKINITGVPQRCALRMGSLTLAEARSALPVQFQHFGTAQCFLLRVDRSLVSVTVQLPRLVITKCSTTTGTSSVPRALELVLMCLIR